MQIKEAYERNRRDQWRTLIDHYSVKGYHINKGTIFALAAYRKAKTDCEFFERQWCELREPIMGDVRLTWEPDYDWCMGDLKGDCFDPRVNSNIQRSRLEREEREFEGKIASEGVWGLVGEVFDGKEWQVADSCFGFVGQDADDYEQDIKQACLDMSDAILTNRSE